MPCARCWMPKTSRLETQHIHIDRNISLSSIDVRVQTAMVKQHKEQMNDYKMRTSHAEHKRPVRVQQRKDVQVAHSDGCCSPKASQQTPRKEHHHQHTSHHANAHERTHSRLDPPEPFYRHQGRVEKSPRSKVGTPPPRKTASVEPAHVVQRESPVPSEDETKKKKKSGCCCCTIL